MWSDGVIHDLGAGQAVAINDAGDIIGNIGLDAYVWRNGTSEQLPSLGGPSFTVAINKHGVIAGTSAPAGGAQHAVVWNNGTLVDLGSGPGEGAAVVAIDDHGDVIGYSGTCVARTEGGCQAIVGSTRAILWRRLTDDVAQQ
jgi:probable HAF family extracellular repeat protein